MGVLKLNSLINNSSRAAWHCLSRCSRFEISSNSCRSDLEIYFGYSRLFENIKDSSDDAPGSSLRTWYTNSPLYIELQNKRAVEAAAGTRRIAPLWAAEEEVAAVAEEAEDRVYLARDQPNRSKEWRRVSFRTTNYRPWRNYSGSLCVSSNRTMSTSSFWRCACSNEFYTGYPSTGPSVAIG